VRVASSERPTWWDWTRGDPDQEGSYVTALVEQGGKLVPVGRVEGLGRGERVYAVRFAGELGYVVTFRQTDPLYTVDLSRPARPAVRGALELPGYSAYLHPVGPSLMLGVGQGGNWVGTLSGVQLSLFDVSDARKPRRVAHSSAQKGSSSVETDHRAFLYWPPRKLAIVPAYTEDEHGYLYAALGFRVERNRIEPVGRVVHGDQAELLRSVVVGDSLFTISTGGVKENGLRSFGVRGWVAFGEAG
jgi:uncharacterized secreted protein with C-terminal beta-propeller domain